MNHPSDSKGPESFVTGGDVSRFERKFSGTMNPSPTQARSRIHAMIQAIAAPPMVRITRGKDTQSVSPDGGGGSAGGGMAGAAGNFGNTVAQGAGNAGNMMGPAMTAGIQ